MQPEEQRENDPIETETSIQQSDDVHRDDDILKAENTGKVFLKTNFSHQRPQLSSEIS